MSQYSGTIIEAQPDWLTCSAHGEARARLLLELGVRLAKEEEARGNKPRKWRGMGYEGLQVGRATYGQRDRKATELRLSGDLAHHELDVAVGLADSITRLDLAVTWRSDRPLDGYGDELYKMAQRHHAMNYRSALPWTVNDAAGGYTMYLGDRGSEYFFRAYDKEREQRKSQGKQYDARYDRCWRFELEMKASVPKLVLKKLLPEADRADWIQRYLHAYMATHGLEPPFDRAGGLALIPGFRRKSDADSKLNHLAKNVRPTCIWLAEAGRRHDMMQALGLEDSNLPLTTLERLLAKPWPTMNVSGRGTAQTKGDANANGC